MTNFPLISKSIAKRLSVLSQTWDGKTAIIEMKKNDFNQWRQMEWMGWYFEYLCKKYLSDIMEIPYKKKYGNVRFDGFLEFPWDFKSHAENSGSLVIVNDSEAAKNAIKEFGHIGLVLAQGIVHYDTEDREFYKWHEKIKGGKSEFEKKRIERKAPSRRRKRKFDLKEIMFIEITEKTLVKCGTFQKGFINSNLKPRREKILLNLDNLDDEMKYVLNF